MSGIAGIVNLDGAPVDPELLQRMTNAIAYRGPDAQETWSDGPVGFGHTMLHTTPESLYEKQPYSLDGQVWITADARVDARTELKQKLEAKGRSHLKTATDIELILHAYHVWGKDCVKHLVGDFAFAIWDGHKRKLICARDPFGIKQLYYYAKGQTLIFSTDISAILAAVPETLAINESLLLDFLADKYDRWYSETVYEDIIKVKPAHRLVATKMIVEDRYYDFGSASEPHYKSDKEYVEAFRHVFTAAVSCKSTTFAPLGLEVSGGVDSSSIASVLKHLEANDKIKLPNAILYSCVYKQFPHADERSYLNALLDYCSPWPARLLDGDQMWALKYYEQDLGFPPDEPEISLLRRSSLDLMRKVKSDGCRVLLNGYGGDQVLLGDAYYIPSLLANIPLGRINVEWRHFAECRNWSAANLFLSGFAKPWLRQIIPRKVQCFLRPHVARMRSGSSSASWLVREKTTNSTNSREKQFETCGNRLQSVILKSLFGGNWQRGLAELDYFSGLTNIELRYPFLDKGLLEYVLSLPTPLVFRNGRTKWILRQALSGVLPELIRARTTNATCNELVDFGWRLKEREKIKHILENSLTIAKGWVHSDLLRQAWLDYWNGDNTQMWELNAWLKTELWLETRDRIN